MAVKQALAARQVRKRPQVGGLGGHLRGGVVDGRVALLDPGDVA